jgi:hypothetical protein
VPGRDGSNVTLTLTCEINAIGDSTGVNLIYIPREAALCCKWVLNTEQRVPSAICKHNGRDSLIPTLTWSPDPTST